MMAKSGGKKAPQKKQIKKSAESIYHCVENALDIYFEDLDGHDPANIYELVLSQTEKPMLEVVLRQAQGNITKSAEMLGMNRATLRKKLKKYDLE
jgi:Fis family transcriptional regulator